MNAPILEDLWQDLAALYELAADVDFEVRYAPGIDERVRGRAESLARSIRDAAECLAELVPVLPAPRVAGPKVRPAPVAATLYARRVG